MKKVIVILLCLVIALPAGYVGFALPKKPVGPSEIFSASEIKSAMKTAKGQVKSSGEVLKFLKIKYSEQKSEEIQKNYDNLNRENTIVIFLDFATKMKTNTFNSLDIYQNYFVILTRENKDSPWTVFTEQNNAEQSAQSLSA